MFQQIATASSGAAFFGGFNKTSVIFKHPVNSFFDELGGVFAGASGEVPKADFLIR
jgi:hypothetical protein